MKIVCFEDDLIDQKLVSRVAMSFDDIEITFYSSMEGLTTDDLNSFDGIIMDQFLGDEDQISRDGINISKPLAVLSASEELRDSFQFDFVGHWQKPITKKIFKEIMESFNSAEKEDEISLKYIKDITQGNVADELELLNSIILSIEEHHSFLLNFEEKEASEIQSTLHKQKSKLAIFYLEGLHALVNDTENQLKMGVGKDAIFENIEKINDRTSKILIDLKSLNQ